MREIKFRAWLKKENKMVEVKTIHLSSKKIMYGYSENSQNYGNRSADLNDNILMQCIGVKDKNGKEIYEGDIVKLYFGCEEMDIRETTANAEIVYCQTGYGSEIGFTGIYYGGMRVALPCQGSIEVIGNIYENPELLEVKE